MSIEVLDRRPWLTEYLVARQSFRPEKVIVIDAGARFGAEQVWGHFAGQVEIVGFEVDPDECDKLNRVLGPRGHRYFPVAIARSNDRRPLYVTRYVSSSGLYRNDMGFWCRFPDEVNFEVVRTVEVPTADLDSFAAEVRLPYVDFMKLDVEGAELEVLQGGEKCLQGTLGICTEVRFHESSGSPVFSEVDLHLRSRGFRLFDLKLVRHTRKSLPTVWTYVDDQGRPTPGPTETGQLIWGDALYLRDAAADMLRGDTGFWTQTRVLKLACFFELYRLPDCAIELLQVAGSKGILSLEAGPLIDLATPPFRGKRVSYADYVARISCGLLPSSPLRALLQHTRDYLRPHVPSPIRRAIRSIRAIRHAIRG